MRKAVHALRRRNRRHGFGRRTEDGHGHSGKQSQTQRSRYSLLRTAIYTYYRPSLLCSSRGLSHPPSLLVRLFFSGLLETGTLRHRQRQARDTCRNFEVPVGFDYSSRRQPTRSRRPQQTPGLASPRTRNHDCGGRVLW
jgi:hypothetical protein